MAFRFRNTIKIAPGIRLNLGKKGVSLSTGVRGATVTIGKHGVYGNLGIPGTGLSYRTRLDQSAAHRRRVEQDQHRRDQEAGYQSADTLVATFALDDKGNLVMTGEDGEPLSNAERRLMWEQNDAAIRQWLAHRMDLINADGALLLDIHADTPAPDTAAPAYEAQAFTGEHPIPPVVELPAPAPAEPPAPPLRPWHRLPFLAHRREQRQRETLAQWREQVCAAEAAAREAQQRCAQVGEAHRQQLRQWEQERDSHDAEQRQLAAAFSRGLKQDEAFIAEVLGAELAQLDWPRETLVDFQVEVANAAVDLDVDLPEIEDMPVRSAKPNANGQRLLIKHKSQRQIRLDYARHIHGVCLRLAGTVFATLPAAQTLTVSAYSQRVDASTGHSNDEYLLSARIDRAGFRKLNFDHLEQVDPISALEQFELRRTMTKSAIIRAIEPINSGEQPAGHDPEQPA